MVIYTNQAMTESSFRHVTQVWLKVQSKLWTNKLIALQGHCKSQLHPIYFPLVYSLYASMVSNPLSSCIHIAVAACVLNSWIAFSMCVCVCECESVDTGDSRGNRQGEPQPTLAESGGMLLWIFRSVQEVIWCHFQLNWKLNYQKFGIL